MMTSDWLVDVSDIGTPLIIYVQNWRVREHLKKILAIQTISNEPTANNDKADRPKRTWDTLKDLEISKYKPE